MVGRQAAHTVRDLSAAQVSTRPESSRASEQYSKLTNREFRARFSQIPGLMDRSNFHWAHWAGCSGSQVSAFYGSLTNFRLNLSGSASRLERCSKRFLVCAAKMCLQTLVVGPDAISTCISS